MADRSITSAGRYKTHSFESKITKERSIHGKYQEHYRQNRPQEGKARSAQESGPESAPHLRPWIGQAQGQEDGTRPVEALVRAVENTKAPARSTGWGLFCRRQVSRREAGLVRGYR